MTEYVWYACYGSNTNAERFKAYIVGGKYGNKDYSGCDDKTMWKDERVCEFKGDLYFARSSSRWGGKGVAFYDPEGSGKTKMRLYKVTCKQLDDIQEQEGRTWYCRKVLLDNIDGCDVYTLTSDCRLPSNKPCERYLSVVREGLLSICDNDESIVDPYLGESIER